MRFIFHQNQSIDRVKYSHFLFDSFVSLFFFKWGGGIKRFFTRDNTFLFFRNSLDSHTFLYVSLIDDESKWEDMRPHLIFNLISSYSELFWLDFYVISFTFLFCFLWLPSECENHFLTLCALLYYKLHSEPELYAVWFFFSRPGTIV